MASGTHVGKKKGRAAGIVAAVIALVIIAALVLGYVFFTFAGGKLISRTAAKVDLNGAGLKNVGALLRLKAPDIIDIRGCDISAEEYYTLAEAYPHCQIIWDVPLGGVGETYDSQSERVAVPVYHPDKAALYALMPNLTEIDLRGAVMSPEEFEALQAAVPNCHIVWSIDISGQYFDSTTESIAIGEFSVEDAAKFKYFENLKTLDTLGGDSYEAYMAVEELLPGCDVIWSIALGGERFEPEAEVLELAGSGVSLSELVDRIGLFSNIERVELGELDFSREDIESLRATCPGLAFDYQVNLCGRSFGSGDSSISFGVGVVDAEEIIAAAWNFDALEEMNLAGCGLSAGELIAIAEAYPDVFIRADVELYGNVFFTDAAEIDLSGIEIADTDLIESALVLFPNLEKVIMSDCGISDEDMDALNRRHEDVLFVWTLHFSVYDVRTDVTAFCASNVPGYVAPKLTDSELAPIKYLTELEALDLGHMYYTDLSFLENMPHLRYLILVEANYRDISAIAGLENLYYLELFNNTINDISPLLECKNLRHLNLGFTRGYDPDCLREMTWLERLWYPGGVLSGEQIESIGSALEDTETYFAVWDGDGSTGGGWREHESYFEMRDLFNMHYMPGGTGVPGAEE